MDCNSLLEVNDWSWRAHERRRRRRCRVPVVPLEKEFFTNRFGTASIAATSSRARTGKTCGWEPNEVLIGTPSGVVRALSKKLWSEGSRWNAHLFKHMEDAASAGPDQTWSWSRLERINSRGQAHPEPTCKARTELEKMRITPHMLEINGFTEECEGSSTSKQVSNAHEIILKHVESWRPYARTLLTLASD